MVESRLTVLSLSPSYNYSLNYLSPILFSLSLDRKVQTAPLTSCKSSSLHKGSCLPMVVSFPSCALPKGTGPMLPNCSVGFPSVSQNSPFIISVCGCMPLKIKNPIYLFGTRKMNYGTVLTVKIFSSNILTDSQVLF